MSTENSEAFTRDSLNMYLKELSKEYKKLGGRNIPVEIILIGGAAILESYGFREMTTDIDAILPVVSIMKDAINHIGDRFGLPNGWLNADFVKTDSYSRKLSEYSVPYRTFNQVLHVRIVTGEYLIAMKLRAGRKYKNDLSDIVGILAEHERAGKSITYTMIDQAVNNLYDGWEQFSPDSISFIREILAARDYEKIYSQIRDNEVQAKTILLDFHESYPGVMTERNVNHILETKQQRKASVLAELSERKKESRYGEDVSTKEKVVRDE